jgi:hypothetical protein
MAHLHPVAKRTRGTGRKAKGSKDNRSRNLKISRGQKSSNSKRKAVPQKVLVHAARSLPTPEIFNDVPDEMPFNTDGQ